MTLEETAEAVGAHLDEIRTCFKPGIRIAIAVWFPDKPDRDFVLIDPNATLAEAAEIFKRREEES